MNVNYDTRTKQHKPMVIIISPHRRQRRVLCLLLSMVVLISRTVALRILNRPSHQNFRSFHHRHHTTSFCNGLPSLFAYNAHRQGTINAQDGGIYQRYYSNPRPPPPPPRLQKIACYATTTATSSSHDNDDNDGTTSLQKLTVKELKDKLRNEGLPTSGLKAELIERLSTSTSTIQSSSSDGHNSSTGSSSSSNTKKPKKKIPPPSSNKRKFTINPNWKSEFNAKAIQDEFDTMAKKEGFDDTLAYYADDGSFDDDFTDDDYTFDDTEEDEDNDMLVFENNDDIPNLGSSSPQTLQSMDERLAAARNDQLRGRISVPQTLDTFSKDVTFNELQKLGFRREVNPFGNDETPRRDQFKVITGSMTCTGCGSNFQTKNDLRPGFLPQEKFEIQTKLSKIEEAQRLQEKGDTNEWSPEDEVDWLLRQAEATNNDDGDGG